MHDYIKGWDYQPEKCPCDRDFLDWCKAKHISGKYIFHMGTGLHHLVGGMLYEENQVLGLTYSPEEVNAWMAIRKLKDSSTFDFGYKVIFDDIHALDWDMLGKFDVITLFHLGENFKTGGSLYDTPSDVLHNVKQHLKPNGYVLGYIHSAAWLKVGNKFGEVFGAVADKYKTLAVWQVK